MRRLCRPHPQGRHIHGTAGRAVVQVRAGHQPPAGPNARPQRVAIAACDRRRGYRMSTRREFITLLGGAGASWPIAAWAQQPERMRRIGVLHNRAADDALGQARHGAFLQGLQQADWTIGRNVQVETRWAGADADRIRTYAAELVALAPDVIFATGHDGTAPLLQATRSVPIVFVIVPDPVGAGFVDSLARPGGNATGFTSF